MAKTIQKESKIVYLQIGQNYEHLAETKQFDVSEWVSEFPDATIYMLFKRPGEEAVAPVQTSLEDGILTWTISNWETGVLGVGFAEIRAIDSSTGMVKKSHVIPCSIEASVTDEDAAPDYPSWVDRMLRYGENVESIYEGLTDAITEGKADIEQVASDTLSETTDALDDKAAEVLAEIPPTYTEVLEGIAKQYDSTKYYQKYEFVWHDGKIYLRLNNSSSPVGAWNPDDWSSPTDFATSMFELRYDMDWEKKLWDAMKAALYKDYVGYYDSQSSYNAGDVVWKDNANTAPIGFYRAKVDITPSSTYFVPANWDRLLGFDEQITDLKSAFGNNPFAGIEFVVNAHTEHSSTKNRLAVNIKAGDKYVVVRSGGGTLYAYRPDGTSIGSVSNSGVASEDFGSFGIYRNNATDSPITIRMTVAYNPIGADIYNYGNIIGNLSDELQSFNDDVEQFESDVSIEIGCKPFDYNTSGYSYTLSGTSATMENGVPKPNGTDARYKSGYVACSEGDTFTVNLTGGVSARAYAFVQSDGTIIEKAGESKTFTNAFLTAPSGSAFLILQTTGGQSSFIGETPDNRLNDLENQTEATKNSIINIQKCKLTNIEPSYESGGIYPNTGNPYSNSKYIRTIDYFDVSEYKLIQFKINSEYRAHVRFYKYPNTSTGSFQGTVNYLTGNAEAEIKTNYNYARILISRADTGDITISESSSVQIDFATELLKRVDAIEPIVELIDPEKTEANLIKNATFKFVFFSDVHDGDTNVQHIIDFAEVENLDCIINGGDTVLNYLNDPNHSFAWYATLLGESSIDILSAVGNHDAWDGAYWTKATDIDIYNAIVAPVIANFTGIQQPAGAEASGLCYYYKDYGSVRVIIINAMAGSSSVDFWTTAQKQWFDDALADAIANSKHVIVCNHAPFPKQIALRDQKSSWNSYIDYRTSTVHDDIVINTDALDCINTFISNGGTFVCLLTGHTHVDSILTATGYTGQFMVNIASAKYANHPDGIVYTSTDSPYYDCFDYCAVDTSNGIIKLRRIGWNMDASMKERRTLSYNYFTHKLLHE